MCGMYTELMSAPCMRMKSYACAFVPPLKNLIMSDGGFTILHVHHLTGTVQRIRANGKLDGSLVLGNDAVKQGYIFLSDAMILELGLQVLMHLFILGND